MTPAERLGEHVAHLPSTCAAQVHLWAGWRSPEALAAAPAADLVARLWAAFAVASWPIDWRTHGAVAWDPKDGMPSIYVAAGAGSLGRCAASLVSTALAMAELHVDLGPVDPPVGSADVGSPWSPARRWWWKLRADVATGIFFLTTLFSLFLITPTRVVLFFAAIGLGHLPWRPTLVLGMLLLAASAHLARAEARMMLRWIVEPWAAAVDALAAELPRTPSVYETATGEHYRGPDRHDS